MVLPLIKLGTLALRTLSKPISSRLKQHAGFHPLFRQFIINIAQVAGAAIIFEVQRNEARKEERRRELETPRQRDETLSKEVAELKLKIVELEKLSKARAMTAFTSLFSFGQAQAGPEKSANAASTDSFILASFFLFLTLFL